MDYATRRMAHPDSSPASSAPSGAFGSDGELAPRTGLVLVFLLAVALIPRLALFPFNENLYGDAVVRTELAERWARAPHWIASSEDGAYQFGPLHIYAVGTALKVGLSREDAGRAVSLVFGVLSLFPLYFLSRRLFGWKGAVWACLGFAVWGMHLQMSTTGGSESLALFLVLSVLSLFGAGLQEGRLAPILWSGLVLNLACATRYDAWLLIPLLTAVLFFGDKDKVAALTRAVLFFFFCLPFPAVWMQGNELDTGDALSPIRYIDAFHAQWVADAVGRYGQLGFRAMSLFFWPGAAFLTLSPLAAFFGMVGAVVAYRRYPEHRWLIWVMVAPTLYFTFRAAVTADFVPLARFTTAQVVLLLPFMVLGFDRLLQGRWARARGPILWSSAAVGVAFPITLVLLSVAPQGKVAKALNPVSPLTLNPPEIRMLAQRLKREAAGNEGSTILDSDGEYRDVQLAFYSGLPESKLARVRWPNFEEQRVKSPPRYLVRFASGALAKRADFEQSEELVRLGEVWFEETDFVGKGVRLYRKVEAPAPPAETGTADVPGSKPPSKRLKDPG